MTERAARSSGSTIGSRSRARPSRTAAQPRPPAASARPSASAIGPSTTVAASASTTPPPASASGVRCEIGAGFAVSSAAAGSSAARRAPPRHQRAQVGAAVGLADPPALARLVARRRAGEHRAVQLGEPADRGRRERAQLGVHVGRPGLDLAVVGGRVQVQVLAHEARVVGAPAHEVGRHAHDVPVGGELLRVVRVQAQRAPAHLLHRHAGGGHREVDQAVDGRAVPALAEQRARADQDAAHAALEHPRRQLHPRARDPLGARRAERDQHAVGLGLPVRQRELVLGLRRRARRAARRRRPAGSAARGRTPRAGAAAPSGCRRRRRSAHAGRCRRSGRARRPAAGRAWPRPPRSRTARARAARRRATPSPPPAPRRARTPSPASRSAAGRPPRCRGGSRAA